MGVGDKNTDVPDQGADFLSIDTSAVDGIDRGPARATPEQSAYVAVSEEAVSTPVILMPPLARFTAVTAWVLTPDSYRDLVEGRVVATYDQYFRELQKARKWLCRWVLSRCVLLILLDLLKALLTNFKPFKGLKDMFSKDDSGRDSARDSQKDSGGDSGNGSGKGG
jgi:hypothetical protein